MQLFTPKDSSIFRHDGILVRWVRKRTLIEEGHPILDGREHMVQPVTVDYPVTVPVEATPEPASPAPPAPPTDPSIVDRIEAVTGHDDANKLATELKVEGFGDKKPSVADKKAALLQKAQELEHDEGGD